MMKALYTLLYCLMAAFSTLAQNDILFSDDFEDGDFTQNPKWDGPRLGDFIVNSNKQLQLNAPSAGGSILTAIYPADSAIVWEFYIKMPFAPSSSNRTIIILESFQGMPSYGYGIVIGEDGTDDRIRLVRTTEYTPSNVPYLSANSPIVRNNEINARIKIKRTKDRLWSIEADYTGGYAFQPEGSWQESTTNFKYESNQILTLLQQYTETRKDKFFYDDIKIYKNTPDITPPKLVNAQYVDNQNIELVFNEVLDSLSAINPQAYNLDNGIGNPTGVIYNFNKVTLKFSKTLASGTTYSVLVLQAKDLNNNIAAPQSISFTTPSAPLIAEKYDIIINEIMANPNPTVGLPKAEYIELLNRSTKTINLKGWQLKDAGKTLYKLPDFALLPNKYVTIYKRDAKIDFGKYGDTIALPSLFALDNDSDEVWLLDEKQQVIDMVTYDASTYKDEAKAVGGYSLERKNPTTPCLGKENWAASTSPNGGTPSQQNANFSTKIDQNPITLTYAFPIDAMSLDVLFSRSVDINSLYNLKIDNNLKIKTIQRYDAANKATIIFEKPMQSGIIYTLSTDENIKDCVGNKATANTFQFALPEIAEPLDIVINEILFNPKTGGYDYVELYNRSAKAINIAGLIIDNSQSASVQEEITTNYLLLPKQYVVLSENTANVAANYTVPNPNALLTNALPSFNDDEGNITLYRADAPGKKIIDALNYTKDWHYPLLKDQSGVSLERIQPDLPTQAKTNWHSAASVVGFGTPTYQNSQYNNFTNSTTNALFSVEKPRLSPDNDGFEDYLTINYTGANDVKASAKIYDLNGHLVKVLLNNETLATDGIMRWDGDTQEGTRATMGIYILWIEYFDTAGKVGKEKIAITVAYKL